MAGVIGYLRQLKKSTKPRYYLLMGLYVFRIVRERRFYCSALFLVLEEAAMNKHLTG